MAASSEWTCVLLPSAACEAACAVVVGRLRDLIGLVAHALGILILRVARAT